jgi:NlpC/P60 family
MKRYCWYAWGVLALGLILLLALPMRSTIIRLAIVGLFSVISIGLLALTWKAKGIRYGLLTVYLAAAVFVSLPARPKMDIEALRGIYVSKLKSYDGTRYIWGGENHLGIDCSGLVRIGLADALFEYGLRHMDPSAIRSGFYLWWHDSNAIDLGKAASPYTVILGDGSLTKLSAYQNQLAGDLAITQAGSHVLAYLGDDTWIEAEPGVGSTHIFALKGKFNYLSDEQVRFVRWIYLDARPAE